VYQDEMIAALGACSETGPAVANGLHRPQLERLSVCGAVKLKRLTILALAPGTGAARRTGGLEDLRGQMGGDRLIGMALAFPIQCNNIVG
jgi:hypothetical protein